MQCQQQANNNELRMSSLANNARVRVNKIEQTVFITEQILIMNREQGIVEWNANNIERCNIKSHHLILVLKGIDNSFTHRVQNYY